MYESKKSYKLNKNGMSLIEVLVAMGIMAILSFSMISFMGNMNKESQALKEKLALLELESNVVKIFAQNSQCTNILAQNTLQYNFNAISSGFVVPLPSIFSGAPGSASVVAQTNSSLSGFTGGKMRVTGIGISSITPGPIPNSFIGIVEINFDPTTMVRALKPVQIKNVLFNVTPSPTLANARLASCGDLSGCTWNNKWKCTCGADTSGGHEARVTMCLKCVDNKIVDTRLQNIHISDSETCQPCPPSPSSGQILFPGGKNTSKACDFISNN